MGVRETIIGSAEYWALPGKYKPSASELRWFFEQAGAEAAPSLKDAADALARLPNGVKVQGQVKHWCGIFACAMLRVAGVDAYWTLQGGRIKGTGIMRVDSRAKIQPGDIAVISRASHHFIVKSVDYASNTLSSIDGNTTGQLIRSIASKKIENGKGSIENIVAYYRIL